MLSYREYRLLQESRGAFPLGIKNPATVAFINSPLAQVLDEKKKMLNAPPVPTADTASDTPPDDEEDEEDVDDDDDADDGGNAEAEVEDDMDDDDEDIDEPAYMKKKMKKKMKKEHEEWSARLQKLFRSGLDNDGKAMKHWNGLKKEDILLPDPNETTPVAQQPKASTTDEE